ncbi:MAG TPA: multidrug ABC transporter substrate-binding protein [Gemmatimonas aurantiaca]|uniref:Multidrug ABC transporter substrate-binding protein n=2 Tax=Gemmatimonas aurantiaca TaxID=173480 RepID=A0A3D4V7F0_9BACT|nr:ABC transporter permease [Gemmatimonas aurantiaca]BAH37885.1 putative macrolide ABC transporter permease protein [Gemmatimonas aurantiaca T-27]HCT56662.1 multidrug ABC transporter substrate-binding protein [Gemmatimonas aurantiaca]
MKLMVLLRMAMQSIVKNKMRTFLTMLGIVIGVAAVIVMVAIGAGARGQIESQIATLGTNLIVVTPGTTQAGGSNQGAQTFNRLTIEDVEKLQREGTLLSAVSPVINTRTQVIATTGNWRTEVNGVSTGFFRIRNWTVESGAEFTEEDVQGKRTVVILGKTVANGLFPDGNAVGQRVRLGRTPFTVIGVMSAKGQAATGTDQDDIVVVPYSTAQTRISNFFFIGSILAMTDDTKAIPAAMNEIRDIMRESHRVGGGADDFTVRDQSALATTATSTTTVMTALLAAIASISLVVGGIGIMNIMLVSVTERTREIGIRMAIGARGSDVLTQFLVESVVLCLMGGIVGLLAGIGGSMIVGRITGWHTATSITSIIIATGFSAAVGVFFGYYPARKAAALDPIQALRYE